MGKPLTQAVIALCTHAGLYTRAHTRTHTHAGTRFFYRGKTKNLINLANCLQIILPDYQQVRRYFSKLFANLANCLLLCTVKSKQFHWTDETICLSHETQVMLNYDASRHITGKWMNAELTAERDALLNNPICEVPTTDPFLHDSLAALKEHHTRSRNPVARKGISTPRMLGSDNVKSCWQTYVPVKAGASCE
jgi:hypothetical protein